MFTPGELLDNYAIQYRLGYRGAQEFWLAVEGITQRRITLHVLADGADETQEFRLDREASLLSRLSHPGIITTAGRGTHRGRPYLATEYVAGPSLAELLAKGGRMDEVQALRCAWQIASALNHAWNTAAVVMRDLNPATIIVDHGDLHDDQPFHIRLTDFNAALGRRATDLFSGDLPEDEEAELDFCRSEKAGHPPTMAPEQIRGTAVSAQTDMYALGVILFHLLSGRPPFAGLSAQLLEAHLHAAVPDLQRLVPGLHWRTVAAVQRLLAKQSAERWPSWDSCAAHLRTLIDQLVPPNTQRRSGKTSSRLRRLRAPGRQTTTAAARPSRAANRVRSSGFHSVVPDGERVIDPAIHAAEVAAVWKALFRSLPTASEPQPGSATVIMRAPAVDTSRATGSITTHCSTRAAAEPSPSSADSTAEHWVTEHANDVTLRRALNGQPTPAPVRALATHHATRIAEWVPAILTSAIIGSVAAIKKTGSASLSSRISTRLTRLLAPRKTGLNEAAKAIDQGRFAVAETMLDELATAGGNHGAVCVCRARLEAHRGNYVVAMRWAQSAITVGHHDPLALGILGLCHLHQHQARTAGVIFRRLREEHPECILGALGLAGVHLLASRVAQADNELERVGQIDPHAVAYFALMGLRCWIDGDVQGEIELLEQAARRDPNLRVVSARLEEFNAHAQGQWRISQVRPGTSFIPRANGQHNALEARKRP